MFFKQVFFNLEFKNHFATATSIRLNVYLLGLVFKTFNDHPCPKYKGLPHRWYGNLFSSRIQPGAGLERKQTDAAMVTIAEEDDYIMDDELNDTNEHILEEENTDPGPKEHIPKVELLLGDTTTEEQGIY